MQIGPVSAGWSEVIALLRSPRKPSSRSTRQKRSPKALFHAQGTKLPMKIQPNGSKPSAKGPEDYFTGTVRIDAPLEAEELGRVEGAYVTFEPVPALPGTPTR